MPEAKVEISNHYGVTSLGLWRRRTVGLKRATDISLPTFIEWVAKSQMFINQFQSTRLHDSSGKNDKTVMLVVSTWADKARISLRGMLTSVLIASCKIHVLDYYYYILPLVLSVAPFSDHWLMSGRGCTSQAAIKRVSLQQQYHCAHLCSMSAELNTPHCRWPYVIGVARGEPGA